MITGYHGTTREAAECILRDRYFEKSVGKKEWLGTGIYFYFDFADAYKWSAQKENEASREVLHSVIKIKADEYFDLDSEIGKEIYQNIVEWLSAQADVEISASAQQNQCAVANCIWQEYPECKVIAMSFPRERSKFSLLTDPRPRRKEFCVRDNSCIKCTQIIEYRGDDND